LARICESNCQATNLECITSCDAGDQICVSDCNRAFVQCEENCPCFKNCYNGCPCEGDSGHDYCENRCTYLYSADAVEFLKEWNLQAQEVNYAEGEVSWTYNTNLTEHNGQLDVEQGKITADWTLDIGSCAKELFDATLAKCKDSMSDCELKDETDCEDCGDRKARQAWTVEKQLRALNDITNLGSAILSAEELDGYLQSLASLSQTYSGTTVPDFHGCDLEYYRPLDPDLTQILIDQSTKEDAQTAWDIQKYYWDAWNTEVGKNCIEDYRTFVEYSNKASQLNGFEDTGAEWRSWYEDPDFEANLEDLLDEIKPFYELMHGYIRAKLSARYGENYVSAGRDPIPAHIFGNMWAQTWGALYDIAAPFPDAGDRPDATPEIEKLTEREMFDYADEFFQSLGMFAMTDDFWEKSVIKKREDVEAMVCHASAWDFFNGPGDGNYDDGTKGDYRIKQCTVKNQDDFVTIHHEMGHIQYYQQYAHQPVSFRSGANPGFHEAIGDTLALAVSTPKHLQEVGLLGALDESPEADMNYLMSIALDKITFLPFGYLMDKFRWAVFAGETQYQALWDHFRLKYQGVMPPSERSDAEGHFDACGKFHIPNNTPYIRYFVSFILQFQFYEHMCIQAGQYDPADATSELYKCDFYRSLDAGESLMKMLEQGASQKWQYTLEEMLGDGKMHADSLLRYFKPIIDWLEADKAKNGWVTGWDMDSTWSPDEFNENAYDPEKCAQL